MGAAVSKFNYQKAIDTHDDVRADDDFVGACLWPQVRKHLEALKAEGKLVDFKIDDAGNIYFTPVRPKTIRIDFVVKQ